MVDGSTKPTLIVFSGGMRGTPVERLVGGARDAAALDTLAHGVDSGAFSGAILVTDHEEVASQAPAGVEVELDSGPFDFATRLRTLVNLRRIQKPFYVGGGSIPFIDSSELAGLAERLAAADELVISNNFYSADFAGWSPGSAIERLTSIPSDNRLPQLLQSQAGLPHWDMERTIASQFDIDAPADLAVLKLYNGGGRRLRGYMDGLSLDLTPYERTMACFLRPDMIVVAGRVSSATWQYLERETICRVRVLSEERGMQADGREQSGLVRSILGFLVDKAGIGGLFEALGALGDAVFLDSRVLLAHAHVDPTRSDRFLSDLGRWEQVEDPYLRELTRAAGTASVPVVLGGHSLVAGGIMALVQAAWDSQDRSGSSRE